MVKLPIIVRKHLQQLIRPYLTPQSSYIPTLDRHISSYFKSHKSLGPSERRDIYNTTYELIRHHYYLNHLCKGSMDFDLRLDLLHSSDFYAEMSNQKLAKNIRVSFSKQLFQRVCAAVGSEFQGFQLCKVLNTRAPLTVRINPEKTSRGDFMKKISNYLKIDLKPTEISPYGVIVPSNKNIDLHDTEQFKLGHFQVQDEASQIAALQVKCRPGNIVLDYCSGSGGKSLAIAHLLQGKGQIYLHDPREKALQNAKKRFQRAGIQNVQYHNDEANLEKTLQNKADWIILDVPCTGTGTIRRNPDIKIKFNENYLKSFIAKQDEIFSRSLKYLKRNGKIVYITCSLLYDENESQVKKYLQHYNLEVVGNEILRTKTLKGGMDSLFAAVLKRKHDDKK